LWPVSKLNISVGSNKRAKGECPVKMLLLFAAGNKVAPTSAVATTTKAMRNMSNVRKSEVIRRVTSSSSKDCAVRGGKLFVKYFDYITAMNAAVLLRY